MARRILILTLMMWTPLAVFAQEEDPASGEAAEVTEPDPNEPDDDDGEVRGEVPVNATASVVIDNRESELAREQAAAEAEAEAEAEAAAPGSTKPENPDSRDHEFQLGIRGGVGVPFIFGLHYADGPPCNATAPGEDPDTFCLHVGSGLVDIDLSFGVSKDLEITAFGRIGMVGVEPTASNLLQFGLGIRSYLMPEDIFKLYLGVRVIIDVTNGDTLSNWYAVDIGPRGEFGMQVDIIRYLGLYAEIGATILFARGFNISLDVTGGVQVRFP